MASDETARTDATDRVTLTGIRAIGHHGVFDHERRDGQEFIVDLTCWLDMRTAAATDDLAETVDYGALAQGVVRHISTDPVDLIETLAVRIASFCLSDPRVATAEVTVHKPSAPIPVDFADVSVTVRRSTPR